MPIKKCTTCNCEISKDRLDLIPDAETCIKHSTVQRYIGVTEFGHKTGGYVIKVRPDLNAEGLRRMMSDPYYANYKYR